MGASRSFELKQLKSSQVARLIDLFTVSKGHPRDTDLQDPPKVVIQLFQLLFFLLGDGPVVLQVDLASTSRSPLAPHVHASRTLFTATRSCLRLALPHGVCP
jgi:hypothetical protein